MAPSSSIVTQALFLLYCLAADAWAQERQLSTFDFAARRAAHWAWQPLAIREPPDLLPERTRPWRSPDGSPTDPVDRFVLARLQQAGLTPSQPAEPQVLLRRLWFDLIGLPPTPEAVARFTADPSDAAYDREVDELLASPHLGERQARHWLDLVRYAETLGHEFDFTLPNAWRYRDYVIRAFNEDVPFDQFVREHIAGDLLEAPRLDADGNDESAQATAAWWFGEQVHAPVDPQKHQADRIDNQIDVFGKALLGLTVACARCHDHKFDAIRTDDYYALFGFVESSRYVQAPIRPVDVHGETYLEALAQQHRLARTWTEAASELHTAQAAVAADQHEPPGAAFAARDGDLIIASADGPRSDWRLTNDAFGAEPWSGPWCPDPTSESPELRQLPGAFWHSGIAGLARDGVLQTRTFQLDGRYVHVRVAGQNSRLQIVVDGLNLVRDPIYGELRREVKDANAHWLTFDAAAWHGRPAFVQCLDQRAPDLGDGDHEHSGHPEAAWLAVQAVVLSKHAEPPSCAPLIEPQAPTWPRVPHAVRTALQELQQQQSLLPVSPTVPSLGDGTGTDEHVFVRGDPRQPGTLAPRRFLEALAGNAPLAVSTGSGRRELAEAVLAADNPLPARVLVNRLWHHLFGRGLVRSVDNFGALGDAPSHPELLDWLAQDFRAHGWSQKHTLRLLVRSRAYRQDSRERSDARDVDPDNVLLHRQTVRRLEAEAVRDSLLVVAGRLNATMFGPPIPLPLDDTPARGKPKLAGPLDGDGRRSIYLAVRRNFLSPMLLAFDMPTPFATVGARALSNVPAQALTMANDRFVRAMSAKFAERVLAKAETFGERLRFAYAVAFAREPTRDETSLCEGFLRTVAA
ncbi:MAG: DUF1549 and DUF1553 domain-containing protein, partial [Planctomycetota bacterium]